MFIVHSIKISSNQDIVINNSYFEEIFVQKLIQIVMNLYVYLFFFYHFLIYNEATAQVTNCLYFMVFICKNLFVSVCD